MGFGALFLLYAMATGGPPVMVAEQRAVSAQNGFDADFAPIAPRQVGDEPPAVAARQVLDPARGSYLELVNQVSGGFFGVDLWQPRSGEPFPSRLAFDYRADPQLKVNLIARVRFQDYELGFTGPPADTGKTVWLGQLEGVVADGAWHHLEVPLLKLIRREVADRDVQLAALRFENNRLDDYLLAGFGGNGQGTRLAIDNFYLGRAGSADTELRFNLPAGTSADGYAVVVDRDAATQPADNVTQTQPVLKLSGLADGRHYVHVRAHSADGWGPVTHHRIEVDRKAPIADRFSPALGAEACPDVWSCRLADDGLGVSPLSIAVTMGGKVFGLEHPAVAFEPLTGQLDVDLTRTGLTFADGGKATLQVAAADEAGQAMPPVEATFVYRKALDQSPPRSPSLSLAEPGAALAEPLPGEGTFENGLDQWRPFGSETVVERTTETAAAGKYSLKLRCTENGSAFSAYVRLTPFNAARYRILSFDYKVPDRLRVDLMVNFHGTYHRIQFTDRDPSEGSVIGEVPNVVQDDQWHHAEFDLFEMLRARFPNETDYIVTNMLLSGGPWYNERRRFAGNYAGTTYYLDNFSLVPMLGADVQLVWNARDMVGVTGAEVITAKDPTQLPAPDAQGVGQRIAGDRVALDKVAQGMVYLWARLLDGAGNRSEPVMLRLMVDAGRPLIGKVWPPDGQDAAPATVGLELADHEGAGLDLNSLKLSVAGQEYTLASDTLRYDAQAGQLIWDGRRANPPLIFADGQTVPVALLDARDLAGNRPTELPSWQFTMRYAADKSGPELEVSSRTHTATWFENFDHGLNAWAPESSDAADVASAKRDDEPGQTLALTAKSTGPYAAWANLPTPYAAFRYGVISFDYRIPAGMPVHLLLKARNSQREQVVAGVALNGASDGLLLLGRAEQIVADGQWHTAVVPVAQWFSQSNKFPVPFVVDDIGFGAPVGQPGQTVQIDNLIVCRPATGTFARLEWKAFDETGVQGYSYAIDRERTTQPEAKVMTTEISLALPEVPRGLAYFHIRALDGAGNWGPAVHFLLISPDRADATARNR